jgi:2,4-dienoyl-CoA reductase-like NADH-dependent reductase (Old Yellow Enzyme family)
MAPMNRAIKPVEFVRNYLDGVFAADLHAKRVASLADGALGVMTSASLAVSVIGQSLAQARGLLSKHAIKQVDRL